MLVLEHQVVLLAFGVKENNYLGKGIKFRCKFNFNSEESFKGKFSVTNPNFKNSDKSLFIFIQAIETDRLKNFGYKTNKTGFQLEQILNIYDDFNLGLGNSNFYEKIETDNCFCKTKISRR